MLLLSASNQKTQIPLLILTHRLRRSSDAQIKEELKEKKRILADLSDSDIGAEDAYLLAMEPLTMCRSQARQSKDLEKCMYCSCTRCGRPNVTGQLITFIKDSI